MRCLALAEELTSRGNRVVFVSKPLPEVILREISAQRFPHLSLAAEVSSPAAEQSQLSDVLSSLTHPVIAILDGYDFTEEYQSWVKDRVELLICIDDLARSRFICDAVLNQNLGFRNDDYANLVGPCATVFVGPKFSLLRETYRSKAGAFEVGAKPQRVLITMGGGDRFDLTYKALAELACLENIEFDVILGPAYRHDSPAKRLGSKAPPTRSFTEVLDLAPYILNADLVICPSGSTVWQTCCIGAPLITFAVVDNQVPVAKGLAAEKAAVVIDRNWAEGELLRATVELIRSFDGRKLLSDRAKRVVDGRGVSRIIDWSENRLSAQVL